MTVFSNKGSRFVLDGLGQAVLALKDNRLRTVLSILGITIGIAAVMAIGTISEGGHYLVLNELKTFGLKSVWVYRTNDEKDPNRVVRQGTGIDVRDLSVLESSCCSAVRRISPIAYMIGQSRRVIRVGNRFSNAEMSGVGVEFAAINNDNLTAGYFLRSEDVARRRAVAVIGTTVRDDLFGELSNPIGKEFHIGDKKYTVIGLLEHKSRDFLASIRSVDDANNRILLPYTTFHVQMGNQDIHVIQAEATEPEHADLAVAQITKVLERLHNHRYAYKSETMAKYIGTSDRILQGVSLIGIVAASISLLVGGMGIMNVVSTSVLERTKEIGLRKAIGASQAHIMFQFLMESVIISTIGGIFGLTLGAVASLILTSVTGLPLMPSWYLVVIALVVSILVGLLSGYYPARRAAKLRPVIALRYE
jgi:ABC-type antimicrobial peptide transport system permease subunit